MPTDHDIQEYAETLPAIYHDILNAFPEIEPGRKAGYGLAFQTLTVHFANTGRGYGFEEVRAACMALAGGGFLEIKNEIFAHPTDLGERLIAAVSRRPVALELTVPALPTRSW